MQQEMIVIRPHQIDAVQDALRGIRNFVRQTHGDGVADRQQLVLEAIRANPKTLIKIDVNGTLCGDDCRNKPWLRCNAPDIIRLVELRAAARFGLTLGETRPADEIFYIPQLASK